MEQNLGRKPEQASADAGYFSEAAVTDEKVAGIELLVPPNRQKHSSGRQPGQVTAKIDTPAAAQPQDQQAGQSAAETMRDKLPTAAGKAVYKMRKAVVKPVF